MEDQSLLLKLIKQIFPHADDDALKAFKDILPFYLLVTIVIVWIYTQVLNSSSALQDPWFFAAFTILMIVHLLLYWFTIYFALNLKRTFYYILVQGIIVFVIVMITSSDLIVMAMFTSLIGNAIGMLGKQKASLVAGAYYLFLALISLTYVLESPQLKELISVLLPVSAFTIFFAYYFNRQIEARLRVQDLLSELENAHEQLTEYTIRVEELTLSHERRRIARELHDTLAQGLAGLILQLEAAVIHIEGQNSEKAKQIVEQAMAQARTTLVDARKAIDDLRANLDTPQALSESISAEIERFRSATGIPCTLNVSLPRQVNSQISEHIVRTITEGLWNIARHAEADHVSVSVISSNDQIEIIIEDNGVGFNPTDQVGRIGHYGLLGIRERVRLAEGQFSVESAPGKGTKLQISMPAETGMESQ